MKHRYPMPEDFDRMSPAEFDAYLVNIGFDASIRASMAELHGSRQDELPSFGQQTVGYEDPHPWVSGFIWALAFVAFCLMCLLGRAPWQ